jgi:hypothetical protein
LTPSADQAIAPILVLPGRDADGDAFTLSYRWIKNGKPAALAKTQPSLPPGTAKKGELWAVNVTAHDGTAESPAVEERARIKNSPPTAPVLRLSHAQPTVTDVITVEIITPATDPDGDVPSYRYVWQRLEPATTPSAPKRKNPRGPAAEPATSEGGVESTLTKATLPAGTATRGELWQVTVRAFDGEALGPAAAAAVRVQNHPPKAPKVVLLPAAPRSRDRMTCRTAEPPTDPDRQDQDSLAQEVLWLRDGKPVALPGDTTKLPAGLARPGQAWQCQITIKDSAGATSQGASASVTVQNTLPSAPVVEIAPSVAHKGDVLRCAMTKPAQDDDDEPVRYRLAWTVDGVPLTDKGGSSMAAVPATRTSRGQVWQCAMTPLDPHGEGPTARAQVTIGNSPPSAPVLRLTPERPGVEKPLVCEIIKPGEDADGDPLTHTFRWWRNDALESAYDGKTELPAAALAKGDLWRCQAVAHDGQAAGEAGRSDDVSVR